MNKTAFVEDAVSPEDDILKWQLRIARRADALAQARTGTSEGRTDWDLWLKAEREVLGPLRPAPARMPATAQRRTRGP